MSVWAQMPVWLQVVAWASVTGTVLAAGVIGVEWAVGARVPARWRLGLWLLVLVRLAAVPLPTSSWSVFNYLPGERKGEVASAVGGGEMGRGNDEIRMMKDEGNAKGEMRNAEGGGGGQPIVLANADRPAALKTAGVGGRWGMAGGSGIGGGFWGGCMLGGSWWWRGELG